MAKKIIGRFYFKRTINKNLVGEFSNNQSQDEITTESADLIEGGEENFVGKYSATWREDVVPFFATLTISLKTGSTKLFTLEWRGGKCNFDGEGMLCDDILIGNYWQTA